MIEEPAPETLLAQSAESFLLLVAPEEKDISEITKAVAKMRLFTDDSEENRKILVETEAVPSIVGLIDPQYYQHERLIFECSLIMHNLTLQYSKYLVSLGVAQKGLELIRYPDNEVKKNAVCLLANIAREDKGMLLENGIVDQIEWLLQNAALRPSLTSKVAGLIYNLTRGGSCYSFSTVRPLIEYLKYFIENAKDKDTLLKAMLAFPNILNVGKSQVILGLIRNLNLWPKLVELAKLKDMELKTAAVTLMSNMMLAADEEIRAYIWNEIRYF